MPLAAFLLAAGLAGVTVHLGILIHGEWHLVVPRIIFVHIALFCLILTAFTYNNPASNDKPLYTSTVIFSCYLFSLLSSIGIYRAFFHKLRHLPGPKLAAVSKLWHVWQSRNSKNHLVMWSIYKQYGPVVRTGMYPRINTWWFFFLLRSRISLQNLKKKRFSGPNEVSIFHPAGVELLDGVGNENTKDVWYDILHPMTSLAFNRNVEEIRLRRVAWNQAMTSKCRNALQKQKSLITSFPHDSWYNSGLKQYSTRIASLTSSLVDCVVSYNSTPVKINDVMAWFAYDVMGLVTFGKDFGMVKEREQRKDCMNLPCLHENWVCNAQLQFNKSDILPAIRRSDR